MKKAHSRTSRSNVRGETQKLRRQIANVSSFVKPDLPSFPRDHWHNCRPNSSNSIGSEWDLIESFGLNCKKKFVRPQHSLDRLKNAGKPRIGVSPSAVYVWPPDVKSERKYIEKHLFLRLCFFVNLAWSPIMPLKAWTGLFTIEWQHSSWFTTDSRQMVTLYLSYLITRWTWNENFSQTDIKHFHTCAIWRSDRNCYSCLVSAFAYANSRHKKAVSARKTARNFYHCQITNRFHGNETVK